jgi:hypothetical protein
MESRLLENLRTTQAFDEVLRRGSALDRYSAQFLQQIMFTPDSNRRHAAIETLEAKIVDYFGTVLSSDARTIGFANAGRILRKLSESGVTLDLSSPKLRAKVFNDLEARTEDRLRIVQRLVNDKANTLDNRLAAYWLEPGRDQDQKLARLREMHTDMERARASYEKDLASFNAGERDSRPRKPQLDFMAKFTQEVKQDNREQARRVATDAETAAFQSRGVKQFAWITVNASEACPDCKARQGMTGDATFWDSKGRPGSGATVCGAACFCMLTPQEALTVSPSLAGGLNSKAA